MTSYLWDLGYDWDADPNTDGSYELGEGLVSFPDNVVASPNKIQLGTSLGFNTFNTTSGSEAGSCSIDYLWITFSSNEIDQPATCPFSNNIFASMSPQGLTPSGSGSSTIFGTGPFPIFYAGSQIVTNAGKFKFTVYMTVNGPGGSGTTVKKLFRVDPEMVVESVGKF